MAGWGAWTHGEPAAPCSLSTARQCGSVHAVATCRLQHTAACPFAGVHVHVHGREVTCHSCHSCCSSLPCVTCALYLHADQAGCGRLANVALKLGVAGFATQTVRQPRLASTHVSRGSLERWSNPTGKVWGLHTVAARCMPASPRHMSHLLLSLELGRCVLCRLGLRWVRKAQKVQVRRQEPRMARFCRAAYMALATAREAPAA